MEYSEYIIALHEIYIQFIEWNTEPNTTSYYVLILWGPHTFWAGLFSLDFFPRFILCVEDWFSGCELDAAQANTGVSVHLEETKR